jgi:hypothetical protein
MSYTTNPTCPSDIYMKARFDAYMSVVLNSLNHDSIILVGGERTKNLHQPNRKIPFYISPLPPFGHAYFRRDTVLFMQSMFELVVSLV